MPISWSCDSSCSSVGHVEVVVAPLVDSHLQEQRDEPQEGDHCAKTSSARPKQPSQATESSSLMSFLALVALRSAWLVRRRTHLRAKHRAVAILQDCPRGQETHGREWSEPLDGRDRCIKVVGVMHLTTYWRQGMCRCRRHGGHHGRHE